MYFSMTLFQPFLICVLKIWQNKDISGNTMVEYGINYRVKTVRLGNRTVGIELRKSESDNTHRSVGSVS